MSLTWAIAAALITGGVGGSPQPPQPSALHGGYAVDMQTAIAGAQQASHSATAGPKTYTTVTACSGDGACPDFTCPTGQVRAYSETGYQPGSSEVGRGPVCLGGKQVSIAASVASAFRRIPVPTPALHIQPIKGRTLVNFKTNFYATGGQTFTRTVHLLGQAVTLKIHVTSYDFQFGDGQHLSTTAAGGAYPNLTNHHEYPAKGTVHPTLITTWSADYRINHSPWQQVDGTVTKQTPPQNLEVTTARPVLVNPASAG